MRILFTTAWYPNRKVAGDGVFVQKHAQAVALLHDVAVLMVQTDLNVRGRHIEIETGATKKTSEGALHEVLVYVPKIKHEIPVLTGVLRFFWLLAGYLKGYRYIKRHFWQGHRPEVCHVNVLTRAALLPWLLHKIHAVPYIITEHWSRYHREGVFPSSRMHLWFTQRVVKDARYVCPVSLNLEQSMKKWGLENAHFARVGNVVSPIPAMTLKHRVANGGQSFHSASHKGQLFRFVHVSWMRDDSKNISGILRVLSRLNKERQDWHFDFIGEGNDKAKLVAYAQELGLLENRLVAFLPAQDSLQLAESLSQYDALVMFSHFENQPVSVLEALAAGLPVVATSVGEIPKMLAHNRGITVPPGNEDQLYEVLRAFVSLSGAQRDDEELRQQRHQYVTEHHGAEVIARQFDSLYRSCN